jgi:hypothetical protein
MHEITSMNDVKYTYSILALSEETIQEVGETCIYFDAAVNLINDKRIQSRRALRGEESDASTKV